MRKFLLFAGFFGLGIIVAILYFLVRANNPIRVITPKPLIPPTAYSDAYAPKESVKGQIATMSGEIWWIDRISSELTKLATPGAVKQGETYATSDNGILEINFPDYGSVNLTSKSEVGIDQTLPVNFVFDQASGSATFTSLGRSPFSVRSLHLLTTIASGSATINLDYKKHLINLKVISGSIKLAYNDTNLISQVLEILQGKSFRFDDDNRVPY